jgi:hypothetical protein
MALTNTLAPTLSFSLQDNNRNPASIGLHLPVGTTLADSLTFATATRAPLLALTNARLHGANLGYTFAEDAPVVAVPESEVERKLVLVFEVAGGRGVVTQEIPSPVFSIETANTDEIDITNALVAAYAAQIVNGPIGANNGAVNQYGLQITALRRAYVSHRYRSPRR